MNTKHLFVSLIMLISILVSARHRRPRILPTALRAPGLAP